MKKILVIAGPTASGKTSLSIELAKRLNGEIISGDSIQQYIGLDIGSGKVTREEMQGIKHHLIDIKTPLENSDVASFQMQARACIDQITSLNKLPIVCGGTGLYIKALLYDYQFKNESPLDADNQQKIDLLTNEQLYDWLMLLDPTSASKIHLNNRVRLQRAITIALTSKQTKSEQENAQLHQPIYDAYAICLSWPRATIRTRISQRVDSMVENGLVLEIQNLLTNGVSFNDACMKGIGYKEFANYFNGNASLEECIQQVKTHSCQFAKRQETFFRHQFENMQWLDMTTLNIDNEVERIKAWLNATEVHS